MEENCFRNFLKNTELQIQKKLWLKRLANSHCSVLFKTVRDDDGNVEDVLASHGTWDDFGDMMKMVKNYNFMLKMPGSDEPTNY